MSEWNYTKCAKPFESEAEAREYMISKDFAGWILKRDTGYAAVCPTYPDGYYTDAIKVAEIENSRQELAKTTRGLPISSCC
ncbi:MAG: hypothetical protein RLZ65_1052 [Actinomycetota bacterium]|jgi:hypothetical protein